MSSLIFTVISCLALLAACNSGDSNSDPSRVDLIVHGDISSVTLEEFESAIASIDQKGQRISLNAVQLHSSGGDVDAAMSIGRIIRQKRLNTFVHEDSKCSSACVNILIAGVQRYAFGRVGVHRGSYAYQPSSDSWIPADLAIKNDIQLEYFREMGASVWLNDAISTTPTWRIRYLTDWEKNIGMYLAMTILKRSFYSIDYPEN